MAYPYSAQQVPPQQPPPQWGAQNQQSGYPAYQGGAYPNAPQAAYGGAPANAHGGGAYPTKPHQTMPAYAQPPMSSGPAVVVVADTDAGESKYLDQADISVRRGFVRKVYAILCLQLIVTFAIVAGFTFSESLSNAVYNNRWVLWGSIIGSFVFLFAISCFPSVARTYPGNMLCLAGFTLCEAVLVGAIASTYQTDAVIKAVVATVVITGALTLFAFQTKIDFTGWGSGLLCALIVLMLFGIWTAIFPSQIAQTAYAAAGALLFSALIVYDTQLIMGGKTHKYQYEVDEYVFAALNIYLDIIQLFLFLLRLFGGGQRD